MPAYLIFARTAYHLPLEYIGQIELPVVDGADLQPWLQQQARERFGLAGWVEMVAVPQPAIVRVIPQEAPP